MKAVKKTASDKSASGKTAADKKENPFFKMMEDKKRIAKAVSENVSLSSLKDIKFVRPL